MKQIIFDKERARIVFGILNSQWINQQGILNRGNLPQDYVEEIQNKKEYANMFLYLALTQRGGIMSEDPFRMIISTKRIFPDLFDPKKVTRNWNPLKIEEAFRVVARKEGLHWKGERKAGSLGYKIEQHPKAWYHNSRVLHSKWKGDVRNIYKGVNDFEDAFARIDSKRNGVNGLIGMRRKIFALLTIWLQEKKLIHNFPSAIPVDFHAMRIFLSTGVMSFGDWGAPFLPKHEHHPCQLENFPSVRVSENFVDQITLWTENFMKENDFSHMSINPAVWILSRTLCTRHVQNTAKLDGKFYFTPDVMSQNYAWPREGVNRVQHPCYFCQLMTYCNFAVPQAPYYKWGYLIILDKVSFPANLLPGINFHDCIPTKYIRNRNIIKARTNKQEIEVELSYRQKKFDF